jgi:formate hydrogenlyase subunit 4
MQSIFGQFQFSGYNSVISGIIAVYVLIQIAMIENSRMPVDDPKTHLELTMIHEVMILDNSGFDLALIHIGTNLKFALYGILIANILIPVSLSFPFKIALFFGIQAAFAASIGLMESFRARKKLMKNPQFIVTLSSIALVGFIISLLMMFQLIR